MKKLTVVCVLAVLSLAGLAPGPSFAQSSQPPKLVVLLVVDQMRGDYIDRSGHQWSKGLRRLVSEGAWFRRAAYPYLNTFTCVGHATVSTGTLPSAHGLVGNGWIDREADKSVGCTEDASATTISYGRSVTGGNSPGRLLVPTLADELRAQLPGPAKIATFSMKERTAIMLAGRKAEAVAWFNTSARAFVTSSVYTSAPVSFLDAFFKANPIERDFEQPWTRLLPETQYLFSDEGVGEKPATFWTSSFPHPLKIGDGTGTESYEAWDTSPFSDAYLGRMAQAAVDALDLGRGQGTDLLGISFSALDSVGHDFGPTSHEVQDVLARLDDTLGRLFEHLDRQVGRGQYVVALTADHGASPIPEQVQTMGLNAGRIKTVSVTKAVTDVLQAVLGPGTYAVRLANSEVYLEPAVVSYLKASPSGLETVLRALRAIPGVANAYFSDALDSHASAGDADARAALHSFFPGRSGDFVVITKPYYFYVRDDGTAQPGSATTHGSLYDYDSHVPLLLFGAGIKPGEYLQEATPADIAPTMAFLCGITLANPDGRVLVDAIAPRVTAPSRSPRR